MGLVSGVGRAATGVIYVSPSSTSVQVGSVFSVAIRINPGTSVNAVQATMSYNASALQWLSNSIGAFSTCTQNTGGGGSVTLSCAMLGTSTSSDSLIASVSFKALVGSGSSSLQLSNANAANNGTYTNPSVSNGSVSFYSPAPAPSPTPSSPTGPSGSTSTRYSTSSGSSSAGSTSTTNSPTTQPTAQASTPAPKVKLNINNLVAQFDTASMKISTNVPVQVYLQYGINKQNLNLSTPASPLAKTNTISLDKAKLTPGTTYYYQIIAKDAQGNVTKSAVKSFTTKGYSVSVTVLDGQSRPLANQTVTLHSKPMTARTNSSGVATFTNVAPGVHHLEYTVGNSTYSQVVYVSNDFTTRNGTQTAAPQTAAVVLAGYAQKGQNPTALAVAIIILLIIALIVIIERHSIYPTFTKLRNRLYLTYGPHLHNWVSASSSSPIKSPGSNKFPTDHHQNNQHA